MITTMIHSGGFGRSALVLAISLGLAHCLGPRALGDADDDDPEENAAVEEAQPALRLEDVNESLYGAKGPNRMPAIRTRLDRILRRKLESTERIWRLNDAQLQKLNLAGRGDIARLFDLLEEHGRKLNAARQGPNDVFLDRPLNRQTSLLRSKLRSGPFDGDSLFDKNLKRMLTAEQAAELEQRQIVAASSPQQISPANAADILRTGRLEKEIWRIVWNRDGTRLGLVESGKSVEILAFPENRLLRKFDDGMKPLYFDFGPTDDVVAVAMIANAAAILNLASGTRINLETDNSQPAVAFNPDGDTLVTGGYGTTATLWSVSTGEKIRIFDVGDAKGALTPVFSRDGTMLAIGNRNSVTYLFGMETGQQLHVFPKGSSHGLVFDPSGKTLAVVYVDGSLVLWDTTTGKQKNKVELVGNELYTVDWSPDGTVLAIAGYNAPVTLWNADDLSILNELESPEWVFSVKFSPDGTRLVFAGFPRVGTDDKFVEIWGVP